MVEAKPWKVRTDPKRIRLPEQREVRSDLRRIRLPKDIMYIRDQVVLLKGL